ncbi:TetR/AcrR family transcriptional regulator [Nosocomiicoccus massiliensis]|uniref:TetR-like C-terminal domain-containing protein n=1 Tax=Nosocomiicoccus massiliensis TaxID=1232430 RepID=A0AAF1BQZ0_9STAP|nr:TetR-like C-terminal domain-containing protein [Nosocomiicoccus massiliensis]WOS95528.1 TetR-like C-terminal domain-containing protein [Nosocomiicoccus massiliensis]
MENKERDLRVERTKESIKNSFLELMKEKEFEKITVKDITTRARINRGTFYIHYLDKYDLMKQMQEKVIEEMTQAERNNILDIANKKDTMTHPINGVIAVFKYVETNEKIFSAMLGQQGDLSFQSTIKDFMWKKFFNEQSDLLFDENESLVPKNILIAYISSAHLGVIQQWLNSGMKKSPEKMAKILFKISIEGPFAAAGLKKELFEELLKDE